MNEPRYSPLEQEVIVLNAVWGCIGEMVNYEIFLKPAGQQDVTLMPDTRSHQRLFNILLDDFLSTPDLKAFALPEPPAGGPATDKSYLFYLRRILDNPQFDPEGIEALQEAIKAFADWLNADCKVERVWMPSINVESTIVVKRITFIKICAAIARHNFGRLTRTAKELAGVLKANGITVDDEQRFLVLPEFYDWFHDNILSYHLSALAEFLNNIRWGIYDYLYPEWLKSYTPEPDPGPGGVQAYKYRFPADCNRALAREMYWGLMNHVRTKPYMPRFEVTKYLKMRY